MAISHSQETVPQTPVCGPKKNWLTIPLRLLLVSVLSSHSFDPPTLQLALTDPAWVPSCGGMVAALVLTSR